MTSAAEWLNNVALNPVVDARQVDPQRLTKWTVVKRMPTWVHQCGLVALDDGVQLCFPSPRLGSPREVLLLEGGEPPTRLRCVPPLPASFDGPIFARRGRSNDRVILISPNGIALLHLPVRREPQKTVLPAPIRYVQRPWT